MFPFYSKFHSSKHAEMIHDASVRNVISHKYFEDNLVYSTDSPARVIQMQQAVSSELAAGGFALR